jgi:hypothetical protein
MLRVQTIWEVPAETARIAKASLPKGNRYLLLRDQVGVIYRDEQFADLFGEVSRLKRQVCWRWSRLCNLRKD